MTGQPSKGTFEAEIVGAVTRFHREQQGRGPGDVRASIIGDMILVRCQKIFTPVEAHLATSEEGRRLIKSARQELRSINHEEIEALIASIVGSTVLRSYYDMNVEGAEQVEVYILEENIEKLFAPKK